MERLNNIEIVDVLELSINNNRYLIKRKSKRHFIIFDEDGLYLGYIFFNKENFLLNSPIKNFNCVMEFKSFYEAFEFLIKKVEEN